MSASLDVFDKTLQTTNIWLNDICSEANCDRQGAWKALTVVLHRLRNRLPVGLAANLGAQLPILIRGVYYDQFEPAKQPTECDTTEEFVGEVTEWLGVSPIDPVAATKAVFKTLTNHLSRGVIGNVVHALPNQMRELWPEEARRAAEESNGEQASAQLMEAGTKRLWNWNRISVGMGAAAAVAGAAVAARRYAKSDGKEDDFQLRLETDENLFLISSKKVEGTQVVDREGRRIGTIDSFMVDKYTGRVAYAVMSFGGMFSFGSSLFPLPWPLLDYEEEKGGYVLDIKKEELAEAPRFEPNDEPEFDPRYRRSLLLFYSPEPALQG